MNARIRGIALLLLGSGYSALLYQTYWQKQFSLIFGGSSAASAAVLGIFLSGLGAGGLVLGKKVDQHQKPLQFYGNLEIAIAIWAGMTPLFLVFATKIYGLLGGSVHLGHFAATSLRIALTCIVIGPAAFLMGGTLPAAVRAAIGEKDPGRKRLGQIYGINTIGAVSGAFAGPLFLFPTIGLQLSLGLTVCINLLVGVIARAWGRSSGMTISSRLFKKEEKGAQAVGELNPSGLIYFIAGVTGFAFIFQELIWFRLLAPILGGSTITFGIILAVALLGIGIGGYGYSVLGQRKGASLSTLALTLALEGVFLIIPFALGDDLALITAKVLQIKELGYIWLVVAWTTIAGIVIFPTALIAGYQFPILLSLLGQGRQNVAKELGYVYACNTLGTLIGSLLGGFILLPYLGANHSWQLVSLLLLTSVLLLVVVGQLYKKGFSRLLVLGACLFCGGFFLTSEGPGNLWRHSAVGAGRFRRPTLNLNQLQNWENQLNRKVIFSTDGREAELALSAADGVAFIVNGKSDGSIIGDRGTQIMLGLLPALLHDEPQKAFVVGLGTGTTAGILGLLPTITQVDVAEIEPQIKLIAKAAETANGHVLDNPKVNLMIGDARELILGSNDKYDLIISEPSNPYRAGVAALFTQEFYRTAHSHLHEDGLFAQWIQGYEIDLLTLATAINTLKSVYTYVSLWGTEGSDLVLVASNQEQSVDLDNLDQRLASAPYKEWFLRARTVEGRVAFLSQEILGAAQVNKFLTQTASQLNTDDLNLLEYQFARSVGSQENVFKQLARYINERKIYPSQITSSDFPNVDQKRKRLWPSFEWSNASKNEPLLRSCSLGLEKFAYPLPEDGASEVVEELLVGYEKAKQGDSTALDSGERLSKENFIAEAKLIETRLALFQGDYPRAAKSLQATFQSLAEQPLALCQTSHQALEMLVILSKKSPLAARPVAEFLIDHPPGAYVKNFVRQEVLDLITRADELRDLCVPALELREPHPQWTQKSLSNRAQCYRKNEHHRAAKAEDDLSLFISQLPNRL